MQKINTGDKFSKLTIINECSRVSFDKRRFLCQCDCGNIKEVNLIHLTMNKVKSCGCSSHDWHKEHNKDKNPNWKGGKRIESGGYVEIYKPDHPDARVNGYIKEHKLVMEEHLGRYLFSNENIHHLNGDKTDNNLENLELWSTSQPSGQRIEDKIRWAKEIIELYGNE